MAKTRTRSPASSLDDALLTPLGIDAAAQLPATPAPAAAPPALVPKDDRWASDDDDPPALPRDPDAYHWHPVLRKKRADGWTPGRQRLFIETLADTGSVMQAAQAVGMSEKSCYRLRRAPGAEDFAGAWAAAIDAASKKLIDEAFERALVGSDEPVFDRGGNRVGRRFRQSDRMLMFLLRAYSPERFRYAARSVRQPHEPPPPPLAEIAPAMAALGPPPPDPRTLASPADLENRLAIADLCDGQLPPAYRDPDPHARPDPMPLGEAFERSLANEKRRIAGKPPLTDDEWADELDRILG